MRTFCGLVFLVVVMPPALVAQTSTWERQVRDRLARVLRADGETLRIGALNGEETDTMSVDLRPGVTYEFVAVCDDDCGGVRLVLASESGSELVSARADESLPALRFTPSRAMAYRLRVVMAGCRVNPCWYAVGLRQRPAAGRP